MEIVQCPLTGSGELRGLRRTWSEWLVRGRREWVRDDCKVLGPCWEIEYGSCDSLSSVDLDA